MSQPSAIKEIKEPIVVNIFGSKRIQAGTYLDEESRKTIVKFTYIPISIRDIANEIMNEVRENRKASLENQVLLLLGTGSRNIECLLRVMSFIMKTGISIDPAEVSFDITATGTMSLQVQIILNTENVAVIESWPKYLIRRK